MSYLALSCLQGRLMEAAKELVRLEVEGWQSIPGLVPTTSF